MAVPLHLHGDQPQAQTHPRFLIAAKSWSTAHHLPSQVIDQSNTSLHPYIPNDQTPYTLRLCAIWCYLSEVFPKDRSPRRASSTTLLILPCREVILPKMSILPMSYWLEGILSVKTHC